MGITDNFRNAVNENNIVRVRIMMKDSLLTDTSFKEFQEMQNIAKDVVGLYDVHDGKIFEQDKIKWNDDYLSQQMVQVLNNFSKERIEHLKQVVKYLKPKETTQTTNSNQTKKAGTRVGTKKVGVYENKNNNQKVIGAVAGAVVGGIVYSVVGGSFLMGAVVGGVVGTGVAIYKDK